MKIILSLILLSMTLLISGCGYDSMEECRLKELQKCSTELCNERVYAYCASEVGQTVEECGVYLISQGVQSDEIIERVCSTYE